MIVLYLWFAFERGRSVIGTDWRGSIGADQLLHAAVLSLLLLLLLLLLQWASVPLLTLMLLLLLLIDPLLLLLLLLKLSIQNYEVPRSIVNQYDRRVSLLLLLLQIDLLLLLLLLVLKGSSDPDRCCMRCWYCWRKQERIRSVCGASGSMSLLLLFRCCCCCFCNQCLLIKLLSSIADADAPVLLVRSIHCCWCCYRFRTMKDPWCCWSMLVDWSSMLLISSFLSVPSTRKE